MDDYVVSKSGVRVWKSPEAHPLLRHTDTAHPSFLDKLNEKIQEGKSSSGLPRILSENSEDACTWYYFSPLLRDRDERTRVIAKLMRQAFPEEVSPQILEAIPFAEITFWPKLSPPPSRPIREGPSVPDVLITLGDRGMVLIEAKYGSPVSVRTTYDETRDQVIRLIDVVSWHANQQDTRVRDSRHLDSYLIVVQYGDDQINAEEFVGRYKENPQVIEKCLHYRSDLTRIDYQRLSRSVAFIRWPDPMSH